MTTRVNVLNLTPFDVIKVEENEHDFLFTVEPKNPPLGCQKCWKVGMDKVHKHGSRERIIRDINYQGKRVGIKIKHQRYKCQSCGDTFYQELDMVDVDGKMTFRLREYIKEQAIKRPFSQVAEEVGVSHTIVREMFKEYVEQNELEKTIVAPRVLGIDEAHLNKVMRGVFTNVEQQTILELTETRSKKEVIKFMKSMCAYKENIEIVTTDMWKPYHEAVYETLPNAVVVVDKFHVVKYAVQALDIIRKEFREQLDKTQKRLLMHERFVLLKNKEDLRVERRKPNEPSEVELRDKWFARFPTLKEAYYLKEDFRDIYKASSRAEAEELFDLWCSCIDADMKPFIALANMVNAFRTEIFNYFDYKYTNAYTESVNNLIKLIEKNGRGYHFDVLRAKVLFSTKATKKPSFGEGDFRTIGKAMLSSYYELYNHTPMKPILAYTDDESYSFGVDIPTLTEVLQNGEF
jgi:transposase